MLNHGMFLQWGYHRQGSRYLGYYPGRPPNLTRGRVSLVVKSVKINQKKKVKVKVKGIEKIKIYYFAVEPPIFIRT